MINFKKNKTKSIKNPKHFLGLLTRCKDEFFIEEFCKYYFSQGVDEINIIDDDSDDKSIYDNFLDKKDINLFFEKNITQTNYFHDWIDRLKDKYEWVIYVDVDEFIVTKKNVNHTIRDELQTTFKDAHCIKVPWTMMSCNSLEKNPTSILKSITHRWNHNKRHPNTIRKFRCRYELIEVKCIFKPKYFGNISTMAGKDHHPHVHTGSAEKVRDGINNKQSELNSFYTNLRESDIKTAFMSCYHYRIISKENCINKLRTNIWYIKCGYTLEDILSSDHADLADETLKQKTIENNNKINTQL